MDIWHKAGRIFKLSNLGTLIFFLLNIGLILAFFCPDGITIESALPLIVCYTITVLLSLSPVGECFFSIFIGAKEIKRTDIKIRMIPLLEIVFDTAKREFPSMVNSIRLKIILDNAPNAFAIGRKTICITLGLLNLSDEEIMAVLAHEMGHIAYRHSVIQLLIGGANIFISGFLVLIRCICWIITGILTLLGLATRSVLGTVLMALFGSISAVLIWLWTKFCMIFLMWSMRQNEYVADEFAYKIGYGEMLAKVLDNQLCQMPKCSLFKALYSTHPSSYDRIARLQSLGVRYCRF